MSDSSDESLLRILRPGGLLLDVDWLRGYGARLDAKVGKFEDRCDWYHEVATAEVNRLRGLGPERDPHLDFWEQLPDVTARGVLRPAHIRAHRPD